MSRRRERPTGWWCPECKGTGDCQNCMGTGMRGYWLRRACGACGGNRDCTWCAGTGNNPEARR